jgi:cytoskeletal protein CcmA (bactofilin family)
MTRSANPPSILSGDLVVSGELKSEGEVVIEGEINGDIRAQRITVGDKASVKGDVVAQEIEIRGRVVGGVRGNTMVVLAARSCGHNLPVLCCR